VAVSTAGIRPEQRAAEKRAREPVVLLAVLLAALVVSGIAPKDRRTWVLEEAPVFLGVPVLIASYRRFRMTPVSYRLIFLHALLLVVGGHYTFSKVPAGLWLQDAFDLARNHYDRVVHFVGGFAPAIVAREILLRKTRLRPGNWLFCLVTSACLAGSAFYELLEWWAATLTGVEVSAFLATQGDVWDTQWDMLLGFSGAIAGQLLLARRQDRELAALETRSR
jgi:putative membrane protein